MCWCRRRASAQRWARRKAGRKTGQEKGERQGERQAERRGERQGERQGEDAATGADCVKGTPHGVTFANGRSCVINRRDVITTAGVTGTPAARSAAANQTLQNLNM